MLVHFLVLLLLVTTYCRIIATEDPIVQLPQGKIRGHILQSEAGCPYYAFQQIPYAAAPVGVNRFQPPKKREPWSGILNTTQNNIACYQKVVEAPATMDEDCLFLNVYSPVAPGSSTLLPVYVWIHGGGYVKGSGAFQRWGPKFIIDHDVVVVTINYRLGSFGFLTTNDDVIPANLGLEDQRFAFEWVQENIELFGGNKSRVTIAGQSAGSASVGLHLMGPWKDGKVLFSAGIMQSGSDFYVGKSNNAREEAFTAGRELDASFNSTDPKELLKVLQKAPAEEIMKVVHASRIIGKNDCKMFDCMSKGNFKRVPVMIGFCSEEMIRSALQNGFKERAAIVDKNPSSMIPTEIKMSSANKTIAANQLKRIYTNATFEDNLGAYLRWSTDANYTINITKQVDIQSKYADVFFYQFAYKGPLGAAMDMPFLNGSERVGHSEDLKYLWADQTNSDLSKFPEEDQLMLHRLVKLWTNFVKYQNPTPEKDPLLGNLMWPKVDPKQPDNMEYLNINKTLDVLSNPRYFQKVKKVLDYYVTPNDIL